MYNDTTLFREEYSYFHNISNTYRSNLYNTRDGIPIRNLTLVNEIEILLPELTNNEKHLFFRLHNRHVTGTLIPMWITLVPLNVLYFKTGLISDQTEGNFDR